MKRDFKLWPASQGVLKNSIMIGIYRFLGAALLVVAAHTSLANSYTIPFPTGFTLFANQLDNPADNKGIYTESFKVRCDLSKIVRKVPGAGA